MQEKESNRSIEQARTRRKAWSQAAVSSQHCANAGTDVTKCVAGSSRRGVGRVLGHADGSPITETIYTHVISEDGKRIAAQLGNGVWGVLDASWTEKKNGPGVESPKPFVIN